MSWYFLDTSALFKRYINEPGSEGLNLLFGSDNVLTISSLTICEITANLRRLVDVDYIISEDEFIRLKEIFLGEIGAQLYDIIPFDKDILFSSLDICAQQFITPVDSIQLASALTMENPPTFVCCDKKLLHLAQHYGLQTLNPMDTAAEDLDA
ncbi:type II toxin-antitoxin system VapC family toxin [Dethiobacter alkaliphilus]|uniref:PilT protein domain protein n=1 Tax=Dethiobacter alkaliphilus AHT 1 TaxID=555088 RepID=C0GG06_DETAL|nr:type II toxin-antitoxin system VapC family toxin [Dethiobacter alkaliphilus]EEG77695.1 PilT protein domain protein [Dethiobacter alkaliphilus AHT 1]